MSIKMIVASAAALALTGGTPAYAAKSQSQRALATVDGSAGTTAKEERKTCRLIDNSASRMKRQRLCLTREEWKKFDAEQADH